MPAEIVALFFSAFMAFYLATCFAGSVIQTVSGFGFGVFAMSLFPYFMPSYGSSIGLSTLLSLTVTGSIAWKMRRHVNWKNLLPPLVTFTVSSALIIAFAAGQSDALLKKLLGGALIALSVYFIFFNGKITIRPTVLNGAVAGLLGGVLSGLFGMGGPPMVVYTLAVSRDNDEYLGTTQAYFALTSVYTTAVRILNGVFTLEAIPLYLMGLLAVLCGMLVGRRLFSRLGGDGLKKVVYGFMAVSGLLMILQ